MNYRQASPIPEQGQLVTVRQRRYVVTEVLSSTLPPSPLSLSQDEPQYLVSLRSVEDDALGETLEVIWELEPGTRIEESVGLPQVIGFDPPQRLDAFLDAVRWGAVLSADMRALQAPFRSGIDIEDYQLDPLVRAIQMPSDSTADITKLSELHIEMDQAVATIYSWDDLALDCDFYETQRGDRFTISRTIHREVLSRLLELNH